MGEKVDLSTKTGERVDPAVSEANKAIKRQKISPKEFPETQVLSSFSVMQGLYHLRLSRFYRLGLI